MFLSDWRILIRRWYVSLVGLFFTAGLCFAAATLVHPTYKIESTVSLIPPTSTATGDVNPFLGLGNLSPMVDVLSQAMADGETVKAIQAKGASTLFTVGKDQTTTGPIMVIDAEGATPAAADLTLKVVQDQLPLTLARLQSGYPRTSWITIKPLSRDTAPSAVRKSQIRGFVVAGALGVGFTVVVASLVENIIVRRRGGAPDRSGTATADAPGEPFNFGAAGGIEAVGYAAAPASPAVGLPMQQPFPPAPGQQPVQQPVYQEPAHPPQGYQQQVHQPQVYQEPVQQPPVYQQPVPPPVYQEPVQQRVYQEPARPEPVYQQPVFPEPEFPEPEFPVPGFPEPARRQSARRQAAHQQPVRPAPVRPAPARPEPVPPEPAAAESARHSSSRFFQPLTPAVPLNIRPADPEQPNGAGPSTRPQPQVRSGAGHAGADETPAAGLGPNGRMNGQPRRPVRNDGGQNGRAGDAGASNRA